MSDHSKDPLPVTSSMLEELSELSRPSFGKWLSGVAFDWLIIGLAMFAFKWLWDSDGILRYPGMLCCVLVIGARQHALALMGHEGAHRAISRHAKLNDLITETLTFWFVGIGIKEYKAFHFGHHRLVGTADDPELIHKLSRWSLVRQWTLPLRNPKLLRNALSDFIGGSFPHTAIVFGLLMRPRTLYSWIVPRFYMLAWIGVFWFFGLLWVPILWFVCLSSSFWLAFRLRIWTEHIVECGASDPTQRISATPLERFFILPHNTFCHWEHHLTWDVLKLPTPCWNLPRAREILSGPSFPEVISLAELLRKLRAAAPSLGTIQN